MSKPARLSPAQIALRSATLAVLAIAAGVSLSQAIHGALTSSTELPWAAASLLRAGIDPWRAGDIAPPPYLHALYIVFRPLAMLSFPHAALAWCCLNVAFSIGSVALLARLFRLSKFAAVCLLFLLWISAPFRSTLEAGGIDILELFLLSIVFIAGNSTLRGVALGFSFCGYLYAPVGASFFWFRGHVRTVAIAATVPILALIMTCGLLGKPVSEMMLVPFAASSAPAGTADLLTGLQSAVQLYFPAFKLPGIWTILAGCLMSGAFALFISRRDMSRAAQFALVGTCSLFAITQPLHAYLLLIAPLGYALSQQGREIRVSTLPIVAALWTSDRLFGYAAQFGPAYRSMATIAASGLLGAMVAHLAFMLPRIEGQLAKQAEPADPARSATEFEMFLA